MSVAVHSALKVLEGLKEAETPAEGLDPREWVYDLTKNTAIGPNHKLKSITGPSKPNNNFKLFIKETVVLLVRKRTFEVPVNAELVVFRKITKTASGAWNLPGFQRRMVLASVFIRELGHITQLNVHMDGHVSITRSGIRF